MSERILRLTGSHNLRDLGGLLTTDGRSVRRGRVFRSDYPGFADHEQGASVRDLALRTVVDLRRRTESDFECVAWADHGVAYHRCPLTARDRSAWDARYAAYLTDRPETVVEAVRRVLDPAGHPVLFHCAAGKDRTGVIAALVLGLLGASAPEIVADYVLSESAVGAVLERLRTGGGPYAEMLADPGLRDQTPRAEHMAGFLAWLSERGGAESWLLEHGLSAEEIIRGRDALLG